MSAGATPRGDNVVAFPGRGRPAPVAAHAPGYVVVVRDAMGLDAFALDGDHVLAPFASRERDAVREALRSALALLDEGLDATATPEEVRGAFAHFHLRLPLMPSHRPEEDGVVFDAAGREAFTVDHSGERPDREARALARLFATTINGLAGLPDAVPADAPEAGE